MRTWGSGDEAAPAAAPAAPLCRPPLLLLLLLLELMGVGVRVRLRLLRLLCCLLVRRRRRWGQLPWRRCKACGRQRGQRHTPDRQPRPRKPRESGRGNA